MRVKKLYRFVDDWAINEVPLREDVLDSFAVEQKPDRETLERCVKLGSITRIVSGALEICVECPYCKNEMQMYIGYCTEIQRPFVCSACDSEFALTVKLVFPFSSPMQWSLKSEAEFEKFKLKRG